jgi:hypothetical protein
MSFKHPLFFSLACTLAATALICANADSQTASTDGLLFRAPFDNSLDSNINNGILQPPLNKKGDYGFTTGKAGQALQTGSKDSYLLYDASKLNAAEGTLSLWVRPEWAMDTENFHMFWTMVSDGQFLVYKHGSGKSLCFLVQGQGMTGEQALVLQANIADWKKSEWHHIAATWTAGNLRLYVDGDLKREANDPNLVLPKINPGAIFMVGDYYHPNWGTQSGLSGKADSALDDLRIYDHSLTAKEIRALAGKEDAIMKPPTPPRVVVPKTSHPPKIDGSFSFDEWKDAAGFSGFTDILNGKLADKQTSVLLTYDDANLYMAMFSPYLPGTSLQAAAGVRDGTTYTDDCFEIYLDPEGKRKTGQGVQFIGNNNSVYADFRDSDLNWNANWQYKSLRTNFGGLGVDYFISEISVPFADLGRATPKDGEEWAANFARSWVAGQQANTSWAWLLKQPYATGERFGTLEFREKAPAFQWTKLRDLAEGEPIVEGTLHSSEAAKLSVSLADSNRLLGEQDLKFDAAKAQPWSKTVDLAGTSSGTLKVEARAKDRLLYSAEMPYELDTKPMRLFVSPLPSSDKLLVDVDPFQYRRQWAKGWSVEVDVKDKAAKTVVKTNIDDFKPPFARASFDLKQIPVGEYQIAVTLRDAANKAVAQQATAFTKPPAAPWLNNRIGITDRVLKPWTPIVATDNDLSMWGRTYSFGRNAFPQQVSSLKQPLLQGPIRFMLDGKPLAASAAGKYTEKTPAKVQSTGTAKAGAWNVEWNRSAAFDGVLWYDVTLTPQAGGATLQSLSLDLPMTPSASTLFVSCDSGMGGEAGAVPAHWKSPWKQGFWIGNEKMGLHWFTESDQNWNLADPKAALTFERGTKSTVARVNFVTKPMQVNKPITYRFGLLATPSRPMPQGWRGWQFASSTTETFINVDPEKPTHAMSWWMSWSPYISAPYDILPNAKAIPDAFHKVGSKAIPYNALTVVNEAARDFSYFRSEWLVHPQKAAGGESGVDQQSWFVSPKSSYKEYMLQGLRDSVRSLGWDGHYFDFDGGAIPDTSELHGSGYVNEAGERRPTYDIREYRDFHQRLWAMLQDELHTDEPVVMVHNSASLAPAIHTFTNMWLDGEQFNFAPKVSDDYTKVLSRDTFRAEFLGSNFGSVVVFLPALGHLHEDWKQAKTPETKDATRKRLQSGTDTLLLYPMLHGTLFLPSWQDMEYLRPLYEARHALDIGTARFYGYWENKDLVSMSGGNTDVVASIYAQDNRFWLVVGNWNGTEQNVTATLSMDKISSKLGTNPALKKLWKSDSATRNGNQVRLTVPAKAMSIVEIG